MSASHINFKNKNFIMVASYYIKLVYDTFLLILYIKFINIFYYGVLRTLLKKAKLIRSASHIIIKGNYTGTPAHQQSWKRRF